MYFRIKGKTDLNDVTADIKSLSPSKRIVDIVHVNTITVWKRYLIEVDITTTSNPSNIVKVEHDGEIVIYDVTKNISSGMHFGSKSTSSIAEIRATSIKKKYKVLATRDTTFLRIVSGDVEAVDFVSCGSLVDISEMCSNISTIKSFAISDKSDNKIKNMSRMLADTSILNIPNIKTNALEDASDMFKGSSIVSSPVMDLSKVNDASGMFMDTTIQVMPPMDMPEVTNLDSMFENCKNIKHTSSMTIPKVLTLNKMFKNATGLLSFSKITADTATDIEGMFQGCTSLTGSSTRVDNTLYMKSVKNIRDLFNGCTLVDAAGGAGVQFNVLGSSVEEGTRAYKNTKTSGYASDLSRLKYGEEMFNNTGYVTLVPHLASLVQADRMFNNTKVRSMTSLDMPELISCESMFENVGTTATPIDFPTAINLPKCINAKRMFKGMQTISGFSLGLTGVAPGCDVTEMFANMPTLSIVENMDFSNATKGDGVFSGCPVLTLMKSPIGSGMTSTARMFKDSPKLRCVAGIDTTSSTDKTEMFDGATSLVNPNAAEQTAIISTAGSNWTPTSPC